MSDYSSIMQLFDLPGSEGERNVSLYRDREGHDAIQSENYGNASMLDGDYEAAVFHFKKALEQGGKREDILLSLGAAYEASDLAPQAFRQYESAKKATSNGELFAGLATLYRQYGRAKDAIAELETAVSISPDKPFPRFKLAEALRDMGYRTQALTAIESSVALTPEDSFYHYWMGDLLLEMGRPEEALKALQAAVELSPGDDGLLQLISLSLWVASRRPEAVRAIRLATDMDADKLVHIGVLERFLREQGLAEEADIEVKRLAKMDRYDHDLLARALHRVGLHHDVPEA